MKKALFSSLFYKLTRAAFPALALALGLSLFGASPAMAQDTTVFEQLRGLFEYGSPVADAELIGWRTGRCYRVEQPAVPTNGLLVGWQSQGPDHGPISTGNRNLHTLPVYWANGAPGVFDDPSPQIQQGVERFLAQAAPTVAAARYDERTTYGNYVNRNDQDWALRKVASTPSDDKNPNGRVPEDGKPEGGLSGDRNPAPPPPPLPRVPNREGGQPPNGTPNGPGSPQSTDFIVARMMRQGYLVQYCYYFKQVR